MYYVLFILYYVYCIMYYLCKEVLDAGDGVQHEARQRDHDPHQYQPLVVSPECIKHEPNNRRSDEGGDALEEKEKAEGVGELVGAEEISEDKGGEEDVGGAGDPVTVNIDELALVRITDPASRAVHLARVYGWN